MGTQKRFSHCSLAVLILGLLFSSLGFGQATWSTKTVDTPTRTGGCTGSYTITLNVASSVFNDMASGDQVDITFNSAAGTDATTCTGGTYKGSAIGTMTLTATTISFSAPVAAVSGTAFTIVLNGITHGNSIAAGTITVTVGGLTFGNTGTTNAFSTNAYGVPSTSAAGSDITVCGGTTATMAGNVPTYGTGTWTRISGSGTITTPGSATTGITALAAGSSVFRWTIANSGCVSSTDDVIINKDAPIGGTAAATINCGNPILSLSGEAGTIQWQQQVNGAGGYSNIAGATTDPYTATIVFANSYDFKAVLTQCASTATSSVISVAAGGALTNYTFTSPSVSLSNNNGACSSNYTFTQSTTAARGSSISTGVTATVTFMAGTNAATMTSGTFNGVAIAMGTVVKTATSVTFTTPTYVCSSSSFNIVLNGITNPAWGSGAGTGTVSIPNASTGTDSYSTYSYSIASVAPFFDQSFSGSVPSYATSNSAAHCVNNLTAGRTYCYNFVYPSSGNLGLSIRIDPGTSGCGSYTLIQEIVPASTNCAQNPNANLEEFQAECTYTYAGSQIGGAAPCSMTATTVYTVCYTVPAGCSGINICPLVNCSSGSCGGGGSALPIELLYFDAVLDEEAVKLNWATATETNNNYFTIERTLDGKTYSEIAQIPGAGNSTSTIQYYAVDEKPEKGLSYYRLKQTDFDGKFAYSRMVSVDKEGLNKLKLNYVLADQNSNTIKYQFSSANNKAVDIEVIDVLGNTVLVLPDLYNKNNQELNLDVSNMSKGVYLFKVSDGRNEAIKKFLY